MPDELIPPADSQRPPEAPAQPTPPFAYDVSMLSYATPPPGKPGMITAIGVLSIVLGSVGILYNGLSMLRSAVFATFSVRSSSTSMSVTAVGPGVSSSSSSSTSAPAAPSAVTQADVAAAIAAAQQLCNNRLTSAQLTALQAQLQAPGQQILTPTPQGLAPAAQVTSAQILPDGSAIVTFYNGAITIDAKGQSVNTSLYSAAFPGFNIGKGTLLLWAGSSLLLVGISVYLLVIGIMTLRQSPRGRKLHYLYVVIKIPLAIGGGLAYSLIMSQMMSGVSGGSPFAAPMAYYCGYASGWALLGCMYPIALLFALRSRTVRDYYAVTIAP